MKVIRDCNYTGGHLILLNVKVLYVDLWITKCEFYLEVSTYIKKIELVQIRLEVHLLY